MKLVGGMIVRNEAKRYLKMALDSMSKYCDEIVVMDHQSTDNTVDICHSYVKVVKPIFVYKNEWHESNMRSMLLNDLILKRKPDWIIIMDADEVLEDRFIKDVKGMMNQLYYKWFSFQFCHFWNSMTHYRLDDRWAPANAAPRLFKNISSEYSYYEKKWGCTNIPPSIITMAGIHTNLRIKHYGYARKEDIADKILKYNNRIANGDDAGNYSHLVKPNQFLMEWQE